MSYLDSFALAFVQIPGLEAPQASLGQQFVRMWQDGGWMMWPIGACALLGLVIIIGKFIELGVKGARTREFLREVDGRLAEKDTEGALELARESTAPIARIMAAGLERRGEGSERVLKAVENVGLLEMASIERGLVWLATISTVAPLLGFLGTVMGMIEAFAAIEFAGEVEATLVAGGIKVALITTAAGLVVAIPINVAHNYFVSVIDNMVIDMEESVQRMVDTLYEMDSVAG